MDYFFEIVIDFWKYHDSDGMILKTKKPPAFARGF
jgi:hypothetical protein